MCRAFLMLVVCEFLFFTFAVHAKSQNEISSIIVASIRGSKPESFDARNGVASTILENMQSVKPVFFYQNGFSEEIVDTEEHIQHKILFKHAVDPSKPYIVFVAGLGNDVYMSGFCRYALPLIEKHGYGAILLENPTSGAWAQRNNRLMMTGYEAGWNLYLIIKNARNRGLIPKNRPVHLVGLSLGGNDSLFATYFDSRLKTQYIQSALAFSSPSDRMIGLRSLKSSSGVQRAIAYRLLSSIWDKADFLYEWYTKKDFNWIFRDASLEQIIKGAFYPDMLSYFRNTPHHFKPMEGEASLSKFKSVRKLKAYKNYLKLNQSQWIWSEIKVPFLFVHAKDDPVVPYKQSKGLYQTLPTQPYIGFLGLSHGGHIAFSRVYSKDWLTESIHSYVKYWSHKI